MSIDIVWCNLCSDLSNFHSCERGTTLRVLNFRGAPVEHKLGDHRISLQI